MPDVVGLKPSAVGRSGSKPILIAKGTKQLQAGVAGKVTVRFTSIGKALRNKTEGCLKVSSGGAVTTKTFKLR